MRKCLTVMLTATCTCLIAACDDGTDDGAGSHEHWCAEFDAMVVTLKDVMFESSTPPDVGSAEARELEQMGRDFMELPVPKPIREDFDAALPRSMQRPFPDEQIRARANTYQWIIDNCTLSEEIEPELRQQVADDREYLDGIPPTTA